MPQDIMMQECCARQVTTTCTLYMCPCRSMAWWKLQLHASRSRKYDVILAEGPTSVPAHNLQLSCMRSEVLFSCHSSDSACIRGASEDFWGGWLQDSARMNIAMCWKHRFWASCMIFQGETNHLGERWGSEKNQVMEVVMFWVPTVQVLETWLVPECFTSLFYSSANSLEK